MTNFVGIIHIVVAIVLIILVLVQDSKSNGALGIGGSSGSNSLLGATGAQSLAGKMTVWASVIFAITCLALSVMTASQSKSVVDSLPVTAPVAAPAVPATTETAPATTAPAATEQAPAAPAATEPAK